MRVLESSVEIAASREEVWTVLVDFDAYPDWNPFITSITGVLREGERLVVALTLPGGRTFTLRPRVQAVEPVRRFGWLGHLGIRGVFDGAHEFELQDADGSTVFLQRETFRGALVPLTGRLLARTREGFAAMNTALKDRVERQTGR